MIISTKYLYNSILIFIAWVFLLTVQGRSFFCDCGYFLFWSSEIWSSDNSQHLFDPYTFTHIQHGLVFFLFLTAIFKDASFKKIFKIGILIEMAWELIENNSFVINLYRQNTSSLGYTGDTVINSIGDVIACAVGMLFGYKYGKKWAIVAFLIIEIALIMLIKDSLILNIIMLFYPSEAILNWQLG